MTVHVRAYTQSRGETTVRVSAHERGDLPGGGKRDRSRPPAYKADFFAAKNPPGTWEKFQGALGRRAELAETDRFVISEIFAAEGGVANDPGSTASGGILLETLRQAQRLDPSLAGVAQPRDLDLDQRVAVYALDLDNRLGGVGGLQALRDLGDDEVAAAVADTLFRHGRAGGTMILQRAINRGRMARGEGGIAPDGGLGPQTWSALKDLSRSDRRKLLGEIAEMRSSGGKVDRERARFNYFQYVSP